MYQEITDLTKIEIEDTEDYGKIIEGEFLIGDPVTWTVKSTSFDTVMDGIFLESYEKGMSRVRSTRRNGVRSVTTLVVVTSILKLSTLTEEFHN